MLQELSSLATEQDADKRQKVLSAVADLFVHNSGSYSEVDTEVFHGIMVQLLEQVDGAGRAEFSQKIAPNEHTPRDGFERLARDDDVEVAGPILRHSPILTGEVLVGIAQVQSQAHMEAISGRATLSSTVTDVLAERGDQDVVREVASNTGASFLRWGSRVSPNGRGTISCSLHSRLHAPTFQKTSR